MVLHPHLLEPLAGSELRLSSDGDVGWQLFGAE